MAKVSWSLAMVQEEASRNLLVETGMPAAVNYLLVEYCLHLQVLTHLAALQI